MLFTRLETLEMARQLPGTPSFASSASSCGCPCLANSKLQHVLATQDDDVLAADLHLAQAWARGALTVRARGGGAHAAHVTASAELPLPPPTAFQLMSHPDNAAIFRGIERCTFRRILWSAAGAGRSGGRQTVEVENESGGCWARAAASHVHCFPSTRSVPSCYQLACWMGQSAGCGLSARRSQSVS